MEPTNASLGPVDPRRVPCAPTPITSLPEHIATDLPPCVATRTLAYLQAPLDPQFADLANPRAAARYPINGALRYLERQGFYAASHRLEVYAVESCGYPDDSDSLSCYDEDACDRSVDAGAR